MSFMNDINKLDIDHRLDRLDRLDHRLDDWIGLDQIIDWLDFLLDIFINLQMRFSDLQVKRDTYRKTWFEEEPGWLDIFLSNWNGSFSIVRPSTELEK